jgi:hypothetical protein
VTSPGQVTELLRAWSDGDQQSLAQLMPLDRSVFNRGPVLDEDVRCRDRVHGSRRDNVRHDGAPRNSSNAFQAATYWQRHEWLCRRPDRPAFSVGRARSEGIFANHRLLELAGVVVEEVKRLVSKTRRE